MKATAPLEAPVVPKNNLDQQTGEQPIPSVLISPAKLSTFVIYFGFAATGVGMALPGSVLPTLLAQWSLADSEAGLLFFLAWLGSSLGALLVPAPFSRSLALGALLAAIATFGIAFGTFGARWLCFTWMALFGMGLGITMTSTSLLRCSRSPQRRGMELNRLNLVWSLGACLCPSLAAHSLRVTSVRAIFCAMGVIFSLLLLWTFAVECDGFRGGLWRLKAESGQVSEVRLGHDSDRRKAGAFWFWPIALTVLVFLPTGIESSMGGWIAAYALRTQHTIATTVTAGTCFWIGLLASRTLSSTLLYLRQAEMFVFRVSVGLVVAGTALLIGAHTSLPVLIGTLLVGFGLGPVYPLLLAVALRYSHNSRIFFVAGLGSACLPWLTGVVSSAAGSLRIGLLVPFAASLLMLSLGLRLRNQDWSSTDGNSQQLGF